MNNISVTQWGTTLRVAKSNMEYHQDLIITVKRHSNGSQKCWQFSYPVSDWMLKGWSVEELKKYFANKISEQVKDYTGLAMTVQRLEKDLDTVWGEPGEVVESKFLVPATNDDLNTFDKADTYGKEYDRNKIAFTALKLPGVRTKVQCPCDVEDCHYKGTNRAIVSIYKIIQHLNDKRNWSREKIADWLDELHDSGQVNLEFEPWQTEGESNEDAREG